MVSQRQRKIKLLQEQQRALKGKLLGQAQAIEPIEIDNLMTCSVSRAISPTISKPSLRSLKIKNLSDKQNGLKEPLIKDIKLSQFY